MIEKFEDIALEALLIEGFMPLFCGILRTHFSIKPCVHAAEEWFKSFRGPLELTQRMIMVDGAIYGADTDGHLIPVFRRVLRWLTKNPMPEVLEKAVISLIRMVTGLTVHYSLLQHIHRDVEKYHPSEIPIQHSTDSLRLAWQELHDTVKRRMQLRWEFMGHQITICYNVVSCLSYLN
jgi:hypothetical protein